MQEYRFHGRGGQGVVVLTKLVARLFFQLGKHVKEFPKFGVERRGAPVEGYVRVDDEQIDLNCQIYHPDAVIVMAESILDTVDVTAGMTPGNLILVDSPRPPEELQERLAGFRVATVDGSGIAIEHGLGTKLAPIANTTLFGAFTKLMGADGREIEPAVAGELKKPGKNVDAALVGYGKVFPALLLPGESPKKAPARKLFNTLDDLPTFAFSILDASSNKTGRWRSGRPVYAFKDAPCNSLCPAGNDVRGFIAALAHENPEEALRILLDTSPLPGICGRVCPHPCENECNRVAIDKPVGVNALERYAADHGGDVTFEAKDSTGKRIAIVGSGPAGLSAAWQLVRLGHKVVIYEAAPEPGGMLLLGIPSYRLPRDVLEQEVKRITDMGVEIRCQTAVGKDIPLARLREEFDAVIVAVGMMVSSKLGIPGEEHADHGLDLLRQHNLGNEIQVGTRVVVIGGGNTAIDAAGVCIRKQTDKNVHIVYRRTRAQMPAIDEEITNTLAEGVTLTELVSPREVLSENGKITALVCEKMRLEEADKSGRPRPVPIPDSRFELPCDQVILATGQKPDLAFAKGVELGPDKVRTNHAKLYLCGDCATWDGTVTAAIGRGRVAAYEAHKDLGFELKFREDTWAPRLDKIIRIERIRRHAFERAEKVERPRLSVEERINSWNEVVGELPDGFAEARRCLSCGTCTACDRCFIYCPEPAITRENGVYHIDLDYCKGCGVCYEECPRGIIDMVEESA